MKIYTGTERDKRRVCKRVDSSQRRSEMQPNTTVDNQLQPGATGSIIHLHRVAHVTDRSCSQSFSLILPCALLRGFVTEAKSREFTFGGLGWLVQVERADRHLSAYLVLPRVAPGFTASLDFTFTLLNRQHFTKNESFTENGARFGVDCNKRGRAHYVLVIDLQQRSFVFDSQTALLELELRNLQVSFVQTFQLPSPSKKDLRHHADHTQENKIDSGFFTFGGCEWNAAVQIIVAPTAAKLLTSKTGLRVLLQRHSHIDSRCKLRYQIALTYDLGLPQQRAETSRIVDELVDNSSSVHQFATQPNTFRNVTLEVKLLAFSWINEVQLSPTNGAKNAARLYDKEGQQWLIDSDLMSNFVKLRMYYVDIKNIPRNSIRAVRWNALILPQNLDLNRSGSAQIAVRGGSLQNFYAQREVDDGTHMLMDILVEKFLDKSGYMEADSGAIRVRIEWLSSYLLSSDAYTLYDNLVNEQRLQTRREMLALQAENYSLEKQIFMYQQTIAKCHTRSQSPSVAALPPASAPAASLSVTNNHSANSFAEEARVSNNVDSPYFDAETPTPKSAPDDQVRKRSVSPVASVTLASDCAGSGSNLTPNYVNPEMTLSMSAADGAQLLSPELPNSRSSSTNTLNANCRMLPRPPDDTPQGQSVPYPRTFPAGQNNLPPNRASVMPHRVAARAASYDPQTRSIAMESHPAEVRKISVGSHRDGAVQKTYMNA